MRELPYSFFLNKASPDDRVRISIRLSEQELSAVQLASRILIGSGQIDRFIGQCFDIVSISAVDHLTSYSFEKDFSVAHRRTVHRLRQGFHNDVRFAMGQINRLIGLLRLYYSSVKMSSAEIDRMRLLFIVYNSTIERMANHSGRKRIGLGTERPLRNWAASTGQRGRPPEGRTKTVSFTTTKEHRQHLKDLASEYGYSSLNKYLVSKILSRELSLLINIPVINELNDLGARLKNLLVVAVSNHFREKLAEQYDAQGLYVDESQFSADFIDNLTDQIHLATELILPERTSIALNEIVDQQFFYVENDFTEIYERLVDQRSGVSQ